jgi:glycosyltransferase involved in cell wall biosynthesis
MSQKTKISLIVSFRNEEEVIDEFISETTKVLDKISDIDYEIIFVNDGSTDNSLKKLLKYHYKNNKLKIINMSRRFGPMESIMAGIKMSSGDAVINIDMDLQDPPSLIPEMIKRWREDKSEVVITTRLKRHGESLFKKTISVIGYKILKFFSSVPIEENSGDFRLISRKVIDEYNKFSEIYPFFRFLVDFIGFKRSQIFYERRPRKKGKTKHPISFRLMFEFFEISMMPFSNLPLRLILLFGIFSFFICTVITIRTLYLHFTGVENFSTTSIFVAILIFGSIQSLIIGILSIYIGSIYKETKKRPLYIIDKLYGFDNKLK